MKSLMRFLFLVQRYAPAVGGSEWYIRRLGENLASMGHEVKVLATSAIEVDALWRRDALRTQAGAETINGVKVVRLKPRYLPFHGKTMTLLAFLPLPEARYRYSMPGPLLPPFDEISRTAGDFDLVHASALPFSSIIRAASRLAASRGVPFVVTPFMHLGIKNRIGYGYRKSYQIELLSEADVIIAATPTERNALIELGINADKVKFTGLGIDTSSLPPGDGEAFRKRHNIEGHIVFNVSARTFDKGAQHTVDAMRLLWKRGVSARLVMAGPARRDFRKYMDSLPADDKRRIIDLGVVDSRTKADLFAAGDVFCMPSRAESFGLVYLEAWHYGAAVVAARSGAIEDIIRHENDGLLAPFGDCEAIANAVGKLLDDEKAAAAMVEAGRKRLEGEFNCSRSFDKYYEIVRELSGRLNNNGGRSDVA